MENLKQYPGGGGVAGSIYSRDVRSIYLAMRDDAMRQRVNGFGEWEFMRLLAPTVTGEAREVHNSYMDEWNITDCNNPNFRRARRLNDSVLFSVSIGVTDPPSFRSVLSLVLQVNQRSETHGSRPT